MCIESKRLQLNFVVMLVLHCNKRFYSHSTEVLVLSLVVDLMQYWDVGGVLGSFLSLLLQTHLS